MNKKVEKAIGKALAASLVTGVAASVAAPVSAAEVDFNALYKTAYNAVTKAKAEGTQAAINEARTAINALKGTKAEFAVGEFSKQVDTVQGPKLVAIVKAIMKAQASVKQADINAAKALIEPELPTFWKNSYSQATDNVQRTLLDQVDAAVKKAAQTKTAEDIAAAKALVDDLKTAASATIANIGVEAEKALAEVKVETKLEAVTAVGYNKLAVKFNQAVDSAKATIQVKKGGIVINYAKVDYNADKTVATVELNSRLTAGDYTVTVKGVNAADLTGTVTAQDEKVAKIEVLTTEAPLFDAATAVGDAAADTAADDLMVSYKVTNQYGEDITKTTELQVNSNATTYSLDKANGKITFVGDFNVATLNKLVVTLIHIPTATSVTSTVTAVASSTVNTIAVDRVFNKDGKSLDENTNTGTDKFYLLISGKDQYGNAVSAADLQAALVGYQSNPTAVSANISAATAVVTVEEVDVNGTKVPGIALTGTPKAGTNTVTLITKTGVSAVTNINVAEGVRADVVRLYAPELVVAGEDAYLPAEVYDKNGNLIKDVNILNDAAKGVSLTAGTFELKDGAVVAKVPKEALTSAYVSVVATSKSTYKVASVMLTVRDAAKPVVVRGFDGDFGKSIKTGKTTTVDYTNLVIEDQYGRTMSDDSVKAWLDKNTDTKITVAEEGTDILEAYVAGTNADGSLKKLAPVLNAAADKIVVAGASKNGSEKLTFALVDVVNGEVKQLVASEGVGAVRVTDGTEYASYEIGEIGTIYDEAGATKTNAAAYNKDFKVFGVLNDGSKILLEVGSDKDYSVRSSSAALAADAADQIIGNDVYALSYGDATTKNETVTVTINNNGKEVTKNVTFSKAAPSIASARAVNADNNTITEVKTDAVVNVADFANVIEVTDQYGVKVKVADLTAAKFADGTTITAPTLTIVPVSGTVTIKDNGLQTAEVSGLDSGEEISVRVSFGSVSTTLKVTR